MGPYTSKVQARKSLLHGGKKRKVVKTNKVKPPLPKGNPDSDPAKRRRADKRAAAKKKPPAKTPKPTYTPTPTPTPRPPPSATSNWLTKLGFQVRTRPGIPGLIIAGGTAAVLEAQKFNPKVAGKQISAAKEYIKGFLSTGKKSESGFDFPGSELTTKRKIKPTDVAPEGISPPLAAVATRGVIKPKPKPTSAPAPASVKKNATAKPTTSKREDNFIETMRSAIEGSREGYSGRSIKYKGKIPDTRAKKSLAPPVRGASGDGPGPKDFKAPESTAKKDSRLAFEKYNKTGSKLGMKMDDILRGAFSFMGTLPKSTDEDKWKYKK